MHHHVPIDPYPTPSVGCYSVLYSIKLHPGCCHMMTFPRNGTLCCQRIIRCQQLLQELHGGRSNLQILRSPLWQHVLFTALGLHIIWKEALWGDLPTRSYFLMAGHVHFHHPAPGTPLPHMHHRTDGFPSINVVAKVSILVF